MKLAGIRIQNYKALRDVTVPLSQFVCLTGENNAGKSSVLQALSLFLSPAKLDMHHFFDHAVEIQISVTFSNIGESDLMRLEEEPRDRMREIIKEGSLELTRRFTLDGQELGYYALLPKDKNYSKEVVDAALKGKKGAEIKSAISFLFPARAAGIPNEISTQAAAKRLIEQWGNELPEAEKELKFKPIPTGAGFSITPLLPEDIYIPAVKDLKDDINLKQGSSFGKVLGILMDKIESKLTEEAGLFEKLKTKLTRTQKEGIVEDNRLPEIQAIESLIQKFVRESFTNVDLELEIPPPELKTVLSTARIFVNDGMKGPIDFKGDGLRRAVFFAILRTYVELNAERSGSRRDAAPGDTTAPSSRGYVLLFEEPELFLHPDAQKILFEALRIFSKDHHVIVTTHSPIFLSPGTATFVRMSKSKLAGVHKPFTVVTPVNLTDMQPKDEFQLICFENNNAALFSKKIVLVEGDSEVIVFPHIATTLRPDWSCTKHSVAFVQAKGKGSIQRYRSFFKRFNMNAFVIADLDVLINDFDKLDPTPEQQKKRSELLAAIDKALPAAPPEPAGKDVKDAHGKGNLRAAWNKAKEAKKQFDADKEKFPQLDNAVKEFFDWEMKSERIAAMQAPPNAEISAALHDLLASMRGAGVFVLSKGQIEDYYPTTGITGRDKPSKAQSYRNVITTKDQILANCPNVKLTSGGESKPELEVICEAIFM